MTGRSRGTEAWAGLEGLDDEVLLCGFLEVLWPLQGKGNPEGPLPGLTLPGGLPAPL